jgi:hypothetical protein
MAQQPTSFFPVAWLCAVAQILFFAGTVAIIYLNAPFWPALVMIACLVLPGLYAVWREKDGDGFLMELTGGLGVFTLPVQILFVVISLFHPFG